MHAHTHKHIHTWTHTCAHTHTNTHIYMHAYTHIHTHMYTHAHVHTCICPTLSWLKLSVTFFCSLLVQFGQHTVNNWRKDSFLPVWLAFVIKEAISIQRFFDAHPYSVFLVRLWCGFTLLRTLHLSLSSAHEIFVFPIWHIYFLSSWQDTVCMVLIHLESALAMWRCLERSDGPSCLASACPLSPSTYSHRTREHASFTNKQDISVCYVCYSLCH